MENPGLCLIEMCLKIQRNYWDNSVRSNCLPTTSEARLYNEENTTGSKAAKWRAQRVVHSKSTPVSTWIFVWLDEAGSDNCDQICKFRYSLRGVYNRYIVRGTRISSVVALASQGVLTHDFVTGTMNGEIFLILCTRKTHSMHAACSWTQLNIGYG